MEKKSNEKIKPAREKNKEKSKEQFLNAVGEILQTKGYAALKINDVAATARLDKKLIYRYFGGFDQLLDEYVLSKDFWSNVKGEKVPSIIEDGGKDFLKQMFQNQFDTLEHNIELQKILLWRLSQQRNSLTKLTKEQENVGEQIFASMVDPHFNGKSETFRAICAILVSGLYYLNMSTAHNSTTFCGIDLEDKKGRNQIKKAIDFIVEQTYDNL
ncbi:TetR/AcrR family transcriptional regulator [Pedobacter xixiisoli]|uniref:Transcriptional regulator, TetR family n=1 Tax=Pedobacter xixiisoli TaxID=1476464 RepID=A0A285ZSM4_9SPHI|nr:TetR/AcrR family transcriptional regulator [Pedobacter xixiisoli]SOD12636.1 transcriptional regulator, TetR family [Pedobacter xixiisoli]